MSKFLVAGIVQKETIVQVDKLPLAYQPIINEPYTIDINVGGDAYNESLALKWLGNSVDFLTMIGKHDSPKFLNPYDAEVKLYTDYVMPVLKETPAALILCDKEKKQQIFEDTKDIRYVQYNPEIFMERVLAANMVVLANANFCRPIIPLAQKAGRPIAVNIRNYKKETLKYNAEFMAAADIIYLSDDNLEEDPYGFVKQIAEAYQPEIIILGQGDKGVLLYSKREDIFAPFKTVKTNEIVNTVGAGNALFSCFLHYYNQTGDAVYSIKNAMLFASYKIGFMGTSNGFMTEEQIAQWRSLIWKDAKVYEGNK